MASQPRPPGSYLWKTGKDIGAAVSQEASNAGADIGNTYQAVLYGWNTQAAHNASLRDSSQQLVEETATVENAKIIEAQPEISNDGPVKE